MTQTIAPRGQGPLGLYYYYEKSKRPWRAAIRRGCFAENPSFYTEAEARAAVGLEGGSTVSHARPTEES